MSEVSIVVGMEEGAVTVIDVGPTGVPGPAGKPGPPGPPGPVGFQYVHSQSALSAEWVVYHNMGKRPEVFVTDAAGTVVFGTIKHLDNNTVKITFAFTLTGWAYCT